MYSKNSGHVIENYINIGDTTLIRQRETFTVRVNPPNGTLGDYIPFYFAGHSPMLLNIITGYRGIKQYPQEDLIYIVCNVGNIIMHCPEWCFTDGHAKTSITKFYNNISNLRLLDWEAIKSQYWNYTEDNWDRMRSKQSEFLVKNHIPPYCICGLIVLTAERKAEIETIQAKIGTEIPIYVDTKRKYFYP